jgi:hypothetical protein
MRIRNPDYYPFLCACIVRHCCGSGSGIRCFFKFWIWDGKKSGTGIRDEYPRSFFRELRTVLGLKILKFFDADPDPDLFDPGSGMEKFVSGIQDKHHGSVTLLYGTFRYVRQVF